MQTLAKVIRRCPGCVRVPTPPSSLFEDEYRACAEQAGSARDSLQLPSTERVRGNLQRDEGCRPLLIRRTCANGHEHSGRILYKRAVRPRALLPGRPALRLARGALPACAHVLSRVYGC